MKNKFVNPGTTKKCNPNETTARSIVVSLCDKTGNMLKPWASAGYKCYAIDIQHSIRNDTPVKYGRGEIVYTWGDARSWKPPMYERIAFVAAFPVCTNLAVSGARDFIRKGIPMLCDGLSLFNACEQVAAWSGAPYVIENPIGVIPSHHRKPDYYFHPWFYGDLYTKYTCLWTGGGFIMPEAEYMTRPEGTTSKIWLMPPGKDRANKRSETPEGFAKAVFAANRELVASFSKN